MLLLINVILFTILTVSGIFWIQYGKVKWLALVVYVIIFFVYLIYLVRLEADFFDKILNVVYPAFCMYKLISNFRNVEDA